jgi:hypothetical protein
MHVYPLGQYTFGSKVAKLEKDATVGLGTPGCQVGYVDVDHRVGTPGVKLATWGHTGCHHLVVFLAIRPTRVVHSRGVSDGLHGPYHTRGHQSVF